MFRSLLALIALLLPLPPAIPAVPGSAPRYDCNGNGIEDSVDIAVGYSADGDGNGIPDECEEFSSGSPGGGEPPAGGTLFE